MLDDIPPPPTDEDYVPIDDDEDWHDRMITTAKGAIRPVLPNAVLIMRHDHTLSGSIALHARIRRPWWIRPPPWDTEARMIRTADAGELVVWLAREYGVAMSTAVIADAIDTVASRCEVDPVERWLSSLHWDGVPRVDGWLVRYLHAEDSQYTRAVGTAWLVSAVARTYDPGCQADYVMVIEGKQGIKKSSILECLASKEWYADISVSGVKDSILAVHGPWICEWSELSGMTRSEVEIVKSFISRRVDHVRLPYGRYTEDLPRRCVFAGTTNDDHWHSDTTGARRFWPIASPGCDVSGLATVREQLWAEAVHLYEHGSRWWLDDESEEIAGQVQEERYEGDAWEEIIGHAVSHGTLMGRDRVTLADLLDVLSLPSSAMTTGTGRRVSRIMSRLRWQKSRWRQDGTRHRGYIRPSFRAELDGLEDLTGPDRIFSAAEVSDEW